MHVNTAAAQCSIQHKPSQAAWRFVVCAHTRLDHGKQVLLGA
jgi:hypothetical protein